MEFKVQPFGGSRQEVVLPEPRAQYRITQSDPVFVSPTPDHQWILVRLKPGKRDRNVPMSNSSGFWTYGGAYVPAGCRSQVRDQAHERAGAEWKHAAQARGATEAGRVRVGGRQPRPDQPERGVRLRRRLVAHAREAVAASRARLEHGRVVHPEGSRSGPTTPKSARAGTARARVEAEVPGRPVVRVVDGEVDGVRSPCAGSRRRPPCGSGRWSGGR